MSDGMIERVYLAEDDQLPNIVGYVAGAAEEWGLHPQRLMQLELAIEESVVNICHYAYAVPPGELLVRLTSSPTSFVVELIDEGIPFDPLAIPEPDLSSVAEQRKVGGLGIFFVRRVMDEVGYTRDGTRNVLRLAIHRP